MLSNAVEHEYFSTMIFNKCTVGYFIQIQDLTELEDEANKVCLGYLMIVQEIDNSQAGMAHR